MVLSRRVIVRSRPAGDRVTLSPSTKEEEGRASRQLLLYPRWARITNVMGFYFKATSAFSVGPAEVFAEIAIAM